MWQAEEHTGRLLSTSHSRGSGDTGWDSLLGHRRPGICRLGAEPTTEGASRQFWDSLHQVRPAASTSSSWLATFPLKQMFPSPCSSVSWGLFCLGSSSAHLPRTLPRPCQPLPNCHALASLQQPDFRSVLWEPVFQPGIPRSVKFCAQPLHSTTWALSCSPFPLSAPAVSTSLGCRGG